METIYESKFKKTTWDNNQSLMINIWSDVQMTDQDFKNEINEWVRLVELHHPKSMIADTSKFTFVTTVELQAWVGNEVFPKLIAAGMKKFAVIITQEALTQLALEQTMEEETTGAFQSSYFSTIEDAKKWVIS